MHKQIKRLLVFALVSGLLMSVAGCRGRIPIPGRAARLAVRSPPRVIRPKVTPSRVKIPPTRTVEIPKASSGTPRLTPHPHDPPGGMPPAPGTADRLASRAERLPILGERAVLPLLGFRLLTPAEKTASGKLADGLEELQKLGSEQRWGKLAGRSEEVLRTPELPKALYQTVGELRTQALVLHDLTLLQEALATGSLQRDAGLVVENMPDSLQPSVRGLSSLVALQRIISKPWHSPPDPDTLLEHLASIPHATGDASQAARWQHELARKAEREGHPQVAKKLRDMKSVKGLEEHPPNKMGGEGMNRSLPLLVPEGPAEGVRPPIKESLQSDLPPLEEDVSATVKRARVRLSKSVGEQIEYDSLIAAHWLRMLHQFTGEVRESARQEERQKEEGTERAVARLLGRGLTASERILVGAMSAKGKKPADMATVLSNLDQPAAKK